MALIEKLKAIGDAIRAKTGKTDELTLDQMVTEIEGIEGGNSGGGGSGGGGEELAAELIEGVTVLKNAVAKSVVDYGFYRSALTNVDLPNVKTVGNLSFGDCGRLETIDLPSAENIGAGAFSSCSVVKTINLENAKTIGKEAFSGCSSLNYFTAIMAEEIGEGAFRYCLNLRSVYLGSATTIDSCAFESCSSLETISIPATSIYTYAFERCSKLKTVNLNNCTEIGAYAFSGCESLAALILRTTETVCVIEFTAILNTGIADDNGLPTGEGFIYIPTSMFDAYRAAYEPAFEALGAAGLFDILFRKIEDYPEICG
jgi:hypothetical protein